MKTRLLQRRSILLLSAVLLFGMLGLTGCGASVKETAETTTWNVQDARNGVVRVLASDYTIGSMKSWETGSGFGVGVPGEPTDIFITNRHVVFNESTGHNYKNVYLLLDDDAFGQKVENQTEYIQYTNWDHIVECEVLYPSDGDPEYPDIAVLRAKRVVNERVALPLRSGFDVQVLEKVYSLGYPGSTDDYLESVDQEAGNVHIPTPSGIDSITGKDGVISRTIEIPDFDYTTLFMHSAQINHGNSGGPLIDENGYVIGINTYGINYTVDVKGSDGKIRTQSTGVPENFFSLYVDYAMMKLDALHISYQKDFPAKQEKSDSTVYILGAVGVVVLVGAGITATIFLIKRSSGVKADEYRLQGVNGTYAGRRFPINGTLRMGHDPGRSNMVFPTGSGVSGLHCQLECKGNTLYLQDCKSTNGTYVNGKRIEPGKQVQLRVGDRFALASQKESFAVDATKHK